MANVIKTCGYLIVAFVQSHSSHDFVGSYMNAWIFITVDAKVSICPVKAFDWVYTAIICCSLHSTYVLWWHILHAYTSFQYLNISPKASTALQHSNPTFSLHHDSLSVYLCMKYLIIRSFTVLFFIKPSQQCILACTLTDISHMRCCSVPDKRINKFQLVQTGSRVRSFLAFSRCCSL